MGCGDECPFIPGKRYVDWDLPDPKGRPSTRCAPPATTSQGASPSCSPTSTARDVAGERREGAREPGRLEPRRRGRLARGGPPGGRVGLAGGPERRGVRDGLPRPRRPAPLLGRVAPALGRDDRRDRDLRPRRHRGRTGRICERAARRAASTWSARSPTWSSSRTDSRGGPAPTSTRRRRWTPSSEPGSGAV